MLTHHSLGSNDIRLEYLQCKLVNDLDRGEQKKRRTRSLEPDLLYCVLGSRYIDH